MGIGCGNAQRPTADIATPVLRCDGRALNGFLRTAALGASGTTAVFGTNRGLYFSKSRSFYRRSMTKPRQYSTTSAPAYRPAALAAYPTWPVGPLETLEGLEQLRFLEQGRDVLCVEVDGQGRAFWELNNPEDVPRIEGILRELGID